ERARPRKRPRGARGIYGDQDRGGRARHRRASRSLRGLSTGMGTRSDGKDVTTRLREAITRGRFQPSERLIETELAASLATNRTNVRTALAQLEQEGLVGGEANRGARVRLVSHEDAVEITQARGALEAFVAGLAAARAKRSDHARLRALVEEMRAAVE